MGDEVLDEILDYLGFGESAQTPKVLHARLEPHEQVHLKTKGKLSLWRNGNGSSVWIELRGPEGTVRATRQKVKFLLDLESTIHSWASGKEPSVAKGDLRIETIHRHNGPKLELRHQTWKPIRLSRGQARGLLAFVSELKAFVASKQ
jgi:hypothetical protein